MHKRNRAVARPAFASYLLFSFPLFGVFACAMRFYLLGAWFWASYGIFFLSNRRRIEKYMAKDGSFKVAVFTQMAVALAGTALIVALDYMIGPTIYTWYTMFATIVIMTFTLAGEKKSAEK